MLTARIKYIILTFLLVIASINFIRTTQDILESSRRLTDLKSEIGSLELKKSSLEREIEYKKTPEFIEERARNDLNMVRSGERLLVFLGLQSVDTSPKVMGSSTADVDRTSPEKKENNLILWYRLFLTNRAHNARFSYSG